MSAPLLEQKRGSAAAPADAGEAFDAIREALRGLQFGSVVATVQDGVVVQIERIEKKRLGRKK